MFYIILVLLFSSVLGTKHVRVKRQEEGAAPEETDDTNDYDFDIIVPIDDIKLLPIQRKSIELNNFDITNFLWKYSTVPIEIGEAFNPWDRIEIWSALSIIEENSCIRFIRKRPSDRSFVYIAQNRDIPIHSHLGRVGGRQVINLHAVDQYYILHEFMHTLGFVHEHTSVNRNKHIKVIESNISSKLKEYFQQIKVEPLQNDKEEYDLKSILHFDSYTGTRNGSATILTAEGDKVINPSRTLTKLDIKKINDLYKCDRAYATTG